MKATGGLHAGKDALLYVIHNNCGNRSKDHTIGVSSGLRAEELSGEESFWSHQ
jgi:hypothetical protein